VKNQGPKKFGSELMGRPEILGSKNKMVDTLNIKLSLYRLRALDHSPSRGGHCCERF